ncbi:MAG: hypothetical protein ACTHOP_22700 [Mesorhizobium sp.]
MSMRMDLRRATLPFAAFFAFTAAVRLPAALCFSALRFSALILEVCFLAVSAGLETTGCCENPFLPAEGAAFAEPMAKTITPAARAAAKTGNLYMKSCSGWPRDGAARGACSVRCRTLGIVAGIGGKPALAGRMSAKNDRSSHFA